MKQDASVPLMHWKQNSKLGFTILKEKDNKYPFNAEIDHVTLFHLMLNNSSYVVSATVAHKYTHLKN